MKNLCVIPARYASSRFPGKPLADIHGKPMIWWVYQQATKAQGLDDVVVATDSEEIMAACGEYGIGSIMTSTEHKTHVDRVHEVSQIIKSDLYVCICGDEPIISPQAITQVIPHGDEHPDGFVVHGLMRDVDDPAEALDPSNIKVVVNERNQCLLLTRSMVPYPYKTLSIKYKKLIGIECYSRSALEFFANQPAGPLERAEDVTLLRFLENFKPVKYIDTDAYQMSVDTPKDLEKVRAVIQKAIDAEEMQM